MEPGLNSEQVTAQRGEGRCKAYAAILEIFSEELPRDQVEAIRARVQEAASRAETTYGPHEVDPARRIFNSVLEKLPPQETPSQEPARE